MKLGRVRNDERSSFFKKTVFDEKVMQADGFRYIYFQKLPNQDDDSYLYLVTIFQPPKLIFQKEVDLSEFDKESRDYILADQSMLTPNRDLNYKVERLLYQKIIGVSDYSILKMQAGFKGIGF